MRRLATAAALILVLVPRAATAGTATSCSSNAVNGRVTATIGSGSSAVLERSGDAITFGGEPCGAADVTDTDLIVVEAPDTTTRETLTISLAGGQFAPGRTAEDDGSDEIEISVQLSAEDILIVEGSGGLDSLKASHQGIDLNRGTFTSEVEVRFASDPLTPVIVNGRGGNDLLNLRCFACAANGGTGDDQVRYRVGRSAVFTGGRGDDTITADYSSESYFDVNGPDAATIYRTGGTDTASTFETLAGGDGNDTFDGSSTNDRFIGGGGTDDFHPWGGDDFIDGGDDGDYVFFSGSPSPIQYDLTTGRVTGEGTDEITGVEYIGGTPNDDVFFGDPRGAGLEEIAGSAGRDLLDLRTATHGQHVFLPPTLIGPDTIPSWARLLVRGIRLIDGSQHPDRIEVDNGIGVRFLGFAGDDRLTGGRNHDVLLGGLGDDDLDGRDGRDSCLGGPGTDTLTNCED